MRNLLITIIALLTSLVSAQTIQVPEAFKDLIRISVSSDTSLRVFVPKDFNTQFDASDEFFEDNRTYEFLGMVKLNESKDSEFLISYAWDSQCFVFYKKDRTDFKDVFAVDQCNTIYIKGNGSVYTSGHASTMSNQNRKFIFENDSLKEIEQPFYYIGLKTKTRNPIKIYLGKNENESELIASIPANSQMEVVGSEFKHSAKYFLIKTSFGLIGWWKLDSNIFHENSTIENLFYNGE